MEMQFRQRLIIAAQQNQHAQLDIKYPAGWPTGNSRKQVIYGAHERAREKEKESE